MKMKEELQQAVEKEAMEIDEWVQILGCSSSGEVEQLVTSLSFVRPLVGKQENLVLEFEKCAKMLQGFRYLGTFVYELVRSSGVPWF